jgi:hypothetical protein
VSPGASNKNIRDCRTSRQRRQKQSTSFKPAAASADMHTLNICIGGAVCGAIGLGLVLGSLGGPWTSLGVSWRSLVASWGCLMCYWVGARFGLSWGALDLSWALLGLSCGFLGLSVLLLGWGSFWALLGDLVSLLGSQPVFDQSSFCGTNNRYRRPWGPLGLGGPGSQQQKIVHMHPTAAFFMSPSLR